MAKSCAYRKDISDACNWHQDEALNSTIYILYQTGPTGFLLKEEGESKNFKVFLGDPHSCTCSVFKKEKDLCKHICWMILKKFRVDRNDPLSWQLGLNEREINQILRGDTAAKARPNKPLTKSQNVAASSDNNGQVEQRPITEIDVCPICQDELLAKKLPVSYCRYGCGNNVHIKCMKVWADHQKSNGETQLKCPLCREQFSTFELLDQEYRTNSLNKLEKQDLHYGLVCKSCKSTPIAGKIYKCTECTEFYLCQSCFNTDFHDKHSFVFREKINQKYRQASRDHVGLIPNALAQELARREIGDGDYDLLNQLEASEKSALSQIPEKVIKSWPTEKLRSGHALLSPGQQCRVCLRGFQPEQTVRRLPGCKHRFHVECIDNWLLHSHPTCPIDGLVVWDPVTAQAEKEEKARLNKQQHEQQSKLAPLIKPTTTKIDEISMGIMINFKACTIENKPNTSNTTSTVTNKKSKTSEIGKNVAFGKRVSSSEQQQRDKSKPKTNSANSVKSDILNSRAKPIKPITVTNLDLSNVGNATPDDENELGGQNRRLILPNIEVRGVRLVQSHSVASGSSITDPLFFSQLQDRDPYNVNNLIKMGSYQLSRTVGSDNTNSS